MIGPATPGPPAARTQERSTCATSRSPATSTKPLGRGDIAAVLSALRARHRVARGRGQPGPARRQPVVRPRGGRRQALPPDPGRVGRGSRPPRPRIHDAGDAVIVEGRYTGLVLVDRPSRSTPSSATCGRRREPDAELPAVRRHRAAPGRDAGPLAPNGFPRRSALDPPPTGECTMRPWPTDCWASGCSPERARCRSRRCGRTTRPGSWFPRRSTAVPATARTPSTSSPTPRSSCRLRALDLPLEQVREVLHGRDPQLTRQILARHQVTMESRLEETERIVTELQSGLAPVTHTPVHVRDEPARDTVRVVGEVAATSSSTGSIRVRAVGGRAVRRGCRAGRSAGCAVRRGDRRRRTRAGRGLRPHRGAVRAPRADVMADCTAYRWARCPRRTSRCSCMRGTTTPSATRTGPSAPGLPATPSMRVSASASGTSSSPSDTDDADAYRTEIVWPIRPRTGARRGTADLACASDLVPPTWCLRSGAYIGACAETSPSSAASSLPPPVRRSKRPPPSTSAR